MNSCSGYRAEKWKRRNKRKGGKELQKIMARREDKTKLNVRKIWQEEEMRK
jgi:hypothetical protein